jgi:hypothetical protein
MDKPGAYRVRVRPIVDLYQLSTGRVVQEYDPDHPTSWDHCVQWGWLKNYRIQLWNEHLTVSAILEYLHTETVILGEVEYVLPQ